MSPSVRKTLPVGALLLTLIASGCSYYKVTDPTSGRSYYTRRVERNTTTLMVNIKDARTGQAKTLATTQIEKISKEEFDAAVNEKETGWR
jgi:hypothetical protein